VIVVHQAAEAREDGSQRCIRCGLDLTPTNGGGHWTPGEYIAVDEQDTGEVTMKALGSSGDDSADLCMGAAPNDASVTPPQMLGESDDDTA
jgi:hypothetical protein